MNKNAIRNFAIQARLQLIKSVRQRAYEYEITENGEYDGNLHTVGSRLLTDEERKQRQQLIYQIRSKGYMQVMEEAAYTWFNRFVALRFMEVNGLLPSKVRVFSDANGAFKPEILKEAMTVELDGLNRNRVLDLVENQRNETLYKYLLITQCNALSTGLPKMFQKIANWTELLFPDKLLRSDSVIGQMVSQIPQKDWLDGVQIIGWLYQYYNSELKDDTFALLKKNIKITKERIPAATQLFTPDWIVRYMVENSLGRIYVNFALGASGAVLTEPERIAAEKKIAHGMGWKYFIPEAEQEPDVRQKLLEASSFMRQDFDVTKIKVMDPCMGSGHILVYAFDVLLQIYTACGWSERDAAGSIVRNNLFGLDIDDRAAQLAYFAVMMKARKYNRRILTANLDPNVMAIQDSGFLSDDLIGYVAGNDPKMKSDLMILRSSFMDAKEYGSLIAVPDMNLTALCERVSFLADLEEDLFGMEQQQFVVERLLPLIRQAQIMSHRYDVVATNPPYMGSSGMGERLNTYVRTHYPDSKSDLFAVFIERCTEMMKQRGYQAMITQHSWMFLSSYEKLRRKMGSLDTVNMVHLGARAFEEIGGEVVQTTSFVLQNLHTDRRKGTYCRLTEPATQKGKEERFLTAQDRFYAMQTNFSEIPGSPVAYWLSSDFIDVFSQNPIIGDIAASKQGIATANNNKYLRLWYECAWQDIYFDCKTHELSANDCRIWYPYNKGGEFRKWYGNNEYVVNWHKDGRELRSDPKAVIRNPNFFFKQSMSWSLISPSVPAFRFKPAGQLFDVAGMSVFSDQHLLYLLGLCNSSVAKAALAVLAPTINYQCGDIANIPVVLSEAGRQEIERLVAQNISLSRQDWDEFETSWDFQIHPLI